MSVTLPPAIETQCPICTASTAVPVFTQGRLYSPKAVKTMVYGPMTTVLCAGCGLLYRYPVATDEEIGRYYDSGYYEDYQRGQSVDSDELVGAIEKNRRLLQYLHAHIDFRQKRVLDAGCGRAILLNQLAATGKAAYLLGLEPATSMVDWCQEQAYPFEVVQGTISDFAAHREGIGGAPPIFDIVLLVGVLEHLPDPLKELTVLRRIMAKDGVLYIYTHDEEPTADWDPKERISLVHVLYLTKRTIRRLLGKAGFEIMRLESRRTSMHVFARPGDALPPDGSIITPAQHLRLYQRYRYTTTSRANVERQLRRGMHIPVALARRLVKLILRPWLPALQARMGGRQPW